MQLASQLACCTYLLEINSHFIMVSFSIKPSDQTNETESPNLVNNKTNRQTELKGEYQSYSFFCKQVRKWCSEKFQTEGWIVKLKVTVKQEFSFSFKYSLLILVDIQASLILILSIKKKGGRRGKGVQVELYLNKIHFKHDKVIYFVYDGPFSVSLCLIFLFFFLVCFAFFVQGFLTYV